MLLNEQCYFSIHIFAQHDGRMRMKAEKKRFTNLFDEDDDGDNDNNNDGDDDEFDV